MGRVNQEKSMLYRYSVPLIVLTTLALFSRVYAQDRITVRYALWDVNQFEAYNVCAEAFEIMHPDIRISLEHRTWEYYWTDLTAGFESGTAPDVITDHVAKYPGFVALGQLLDLQPFVDRDGVPTDIYYPGLAEQWTKDGKRYGMPKDWDTVAVIYNVDLLKKAGIDPAIMETWTWNLEDGGTFEETLARLTIDERGSNGLSPDPAWLCVQRNGWGIRTVRMELFRSQYRLDL
jgi:multiple sugar transport system substrate-binding protein